MTDYVTDREQIEQIKSWWKNYGRGIAIAIIVGLIIGFGWRYWHQHKIRKAEQASSIYQSMMVAMARQKSTLANQYAKQLIDQYASTPYASLGGLLWARSALDQSKFQLAFDKLQWVVKHSKMESVRQIARLRSARILLEQGKAKSALAMLQVVDDKTYQPLISMVEGDAYSTLGQKAKALKAYQSAKTALAGVGADYPLLDLKLTTPT